MIKPREHTKRLCIIPLCKNERFDLVHKFPMDNQRAEEWRRAIDLPEINNLPLDLLRKRTICSKHFRKEDYKNVESRSLNKTAVPSLNFRKAEYLGKTNLSVGATCQDQSFIDTVDARDDSIRECQILLQNKKDPVKSSSNSKGSVTTSIDVDQHVHLVKYVCSADNETEEGPSSKYRFVDSDQFHNVQCSDIHLDLIPVTKTLDGGFVASLVPLADVSNVEDSITIIDQSSQFNFLTTKDTVNFIQNADSYTNEIIQQISSSYITMIDDSITIHTPNLPDPLTINNFWLRDHCCCLECYNHETKQRKISFLDIPIDIKPSHYNIDGNELQITWPDNHLSSYDIADLSSNTFEKFKTFVETKGQKTLWNAKTIKSLGYARVSFPDYLCDENVAKKFVSSLVQYGVAFIEKVPPNMLTTELAIKRLFNVHKTFFGEMWAFNDNKVHNDNAYTREYLAAHTDNMYFNDAAGVQALHCLTHTGQGGETLLVDGFNILNDLKTSNEALFKRLCTTNVESEYIEDGRHHTYMAPIVKLNSLTQQPEQIRFNSYDRAPMRSIPMSQMGTFYRDMQTFVQNVQSADNEWWFKLQPGTVVFFDNWRILHGRSSYTGNRKMGGGYVSRTEFMSVARTMNLIS